MGILLISALVVAGTWQLAQRFWIEWIIPYNGDNVLFLTVGRGIANGLLPYQDLFETKSPAIFLVAALSWMLTDSTALARALQIAVLLGIALVIAWKGWNMQPRATSPWQWCGKLLAVGTGIAFALYAGDSAGLLFPESFGAFFAILYVALIANHRTHRSLPRVVAAGAAFGGAIAFKEPFLLTIVGAALLLHPSPRAWPRALLLPMIIGCALWALILLLLGYLGPYFRIFLPMIFDPYFSKDIGILWRGSYWIIAALSLSRYSWPFFLGIVAAVFAAAVLALERRTVASVVMLCATLLLALGVSAFLPLYFAAKQMPIGIVGVAVAYAALLVPVTRLGASPGKRLSQYWKLIAFMAAGYIGIMTAGTGGAGVFLAHHFVYLLPLFAALFFGLCQAAARSRTWAIIAGIVCSLLLLSVVWRGLSPDAAKIADLQEGYKRRVAAAENVDALLDACKWDRYLVVGNVDSLYGFTRHSPLGPGFMQAKFNQFIPFFAKSFEHNLRTTPVVVIAENIETEPNVTEILRMRFSAPIPSCAKNIVPPPGLLYLFAKS